ncbi:MAG: ParB/RepB/Spo0J family partition protein [Bacteroidia bacterium]|nr:ParB/RepB/Spo0J family partition protein [Bacteroidia bacterium]
MAKKLGRGLDALLGSETDFSQLTANGGDLTASLNSGSARQPEGQRGGEDRLGSTLTVRMDAIDPNPYQPRKEFAQEELQELAESIRKVGIIQPLTLRRNGDRYQLISGERRLRAARLAGLVEVPAYIREADVQTMRIMALVENIQRSDLNAIEVAMGYQDLLDAAGCSHEELASFVGKSRTSVTNMLRLLRLPHEVQQAIVEQRISMGHARALLGLESEEAQLELLRLIEEKGLSVRDVEAAVKERQMKKSGQGEEKAERGEGEEQDEKRAAVDESTLLALQTRLGWGLKVNSTGRDRGRVVIEFRTEGEKQELLRKLLSIEV